MRTRAFCALSEARGWPSSEAYGLLNGFTKDSSTAVYAAITGQTFLGSHADAAMVIVASALVNFGRKATEKRVELPGPTFGAAEKAKRGPVVPPKEKQRLAETLRKYSSIPD